MQMHYGEPVVRRAVPLALGMLSASNPVLTIMDTLSRYSHDNDLQVAINAIFAMGLVGAGTNNARLAQMLRQLASYYSKEADCLFMVRIAQVSSLSYSSDVPRPEADLGAPPVARLQGLVHMGKGTIGINPFHTDRSLMSPVAVAGLLATIISFTDAKGFVLDKSHWMLYFIVMAMYPVRPSSISVQERPLTFVRQSTALPDHFRRRGQPLAGDRSSRSGAFHLRYHPIVPLS